MQTKSCIKIFLRKIYHIFWIKSGNSAHSAFGGQIIRFQTLLLTSGEKSKKSDFHGDQAILFFFFEKKNPKWPIFKIAVFQNSQFSKKFCENFMDWSLGY
jgi:hypothetical protein